MKKLTFAFAVSRNVGTVENPEIVTELNPGTATCSDEDYEKNLAVIKEIAYNGEVAVEDVPVTAEEARAMRDKLLAETDWTQVLDAPISAECREAFRVYRQALRDITEQKSFPDVIEWPEMPEVVKAEPDPVDEAVDVLLGGDA